MACTPCRFAFLRRCIPFEGNADSAAWIPMVERFFAEEDKVAVRLIRKLTQLVGAMGVVT